MRFTHVLCVTSKKLTQNYKASIKLIISASHKILSALSFCWCCWAVINVMLLIMYKMMNAIATREEALKSLIFLQFRWKEEERKNKSSVWHKKGIVSNCVDWKRSFVNWKLQQSHSIFVWLWKCMWSAELNSIRQRTGMF